MNRRTDREYLMKLIYEMHVNDDFTIAKYDQFCELYLDNKPDRYFQTTFHQIIDNRETIDQMIESSSNNWKIDRMSVVDLAILRVSVAEILYKSDIPDVVSINEAVNLAKKYGTEKSSGFINGILGNVVRKHERDK